MHGTKPSRPHTLDDKGIQRFWALVRRDVNQQGCWCVGKQNFYQYGGFNYEGRCYAAHRLVYELLNGQLPPADKVLMHMCQNRWCCNPAHLQLGTSAENSQDMWDVRLGRKRPLGR